MAAARGDPRRRTGAVFTVNSVNCRPGPCRDGLNTGCNSNFSREPMPRQSARKSIFASYSKDVLNYESSDELNKLSREGSKEDVLSEVQIHTPTLNQKRSSFDCNCSNQVSETIKIIK